MADNDRAVGLGLARRRVDGAVVDDDDVQGRLLAADVADDARHHPLLVEGGNDREQAQV